MKIKDGEISLELSKIYQMVETEAPASREKAMVLTKLDEAAMWFERIDWWEEGEEEDEVYKVEQDYIGQPKRTE